MASEEVEIPVNEEEDRVRVLDDENNSVAVNEQVKSILEGLPVEEDKNGDGGGVEPLRFGAPASQMQKLFEAVGAADSGELISLPPFASLFNRELDQDSGRRRSCWPNMMWSWQITWSESR